MKQKIVIKVSMNAKKSFLTRLIKVSMNREKSSRPKVLTIAVSQPGVESVAFQGEGKDQLVVIGDGIDSIGLISVLRKSMAHAELLSVGPPEEPKKEEKEKKKVEVIQPPTWPTIAQGVPVPYYAYEVVSYNQGPSCPIM